MNKVGEPVTRVDFRDAQNVMRFLIESGDIRAKELKIGILLEDVHNSTLRHSPDIHPSLKKGKVVLFFPRAGSGWHEVNIEVPYSITELSIRGRMLKSSTISSRTMVGVPFRCVAECQFL